VPTMEPNPMSAVTKAMVCGHRAARNGRLVEKGGGGVELNK
jgi:hypothetical protein